MLNCKVTLRLKVVFTYRLMYIHRYIILGVIDMLLVEGYIFNCISLASYCLEYSRIKSFEKSETPSSVMVYDLSANLTQRTLENSEV